MRTEQFFSYAICFFAVLLEGGNSFSGALRYACSFNNMPTKDFKKQVVAKLGIRASSKGHIIYIPHTDQLLDVLETLHSHVSDV